MFTKEQALYGGLGLLALAFGAAGCSDYSPAEDAQKTVTSRMSEAAYMAQRTPESNYSPRTISGEVCSIDACEDPMRACIGVVTLDNIAYGVMVDSACNDILDVLKKGDKVEVEKALKTDRPAYLYAPNCGVEIIPK